MSKSKQIKNLYWFATTRNFTTKINQTNTHFSGLDFKILFYILNEMNDKNKVENFVNKKLCKKFYKSEQSISTSISKLRNENIIKRTNKAFEIMVNPEYFYNGGKDEQDKKIYEYENL